MLLNLGRIVSGLANIVVIPFRESPVKGIIFLIPPFTFFYMNKHWNTLRRPTQRVIGPLLTVGLVFLAFSFVPSLSKKDSGASGLGDRLQSKAKVLNRSNTPDVRD